MTDRLVRLLIPGVAAAALALSACGGDDASSEPPAAPDLESTSGDTASDAGKSGACAEIRQTLDQVAADGMKEIGAPSALAKVYDDGTAAVRATAKESGDDAVIQAADGVAAALEALSEDVTSGAMPDPSGLAEAEMALKQACS